MHMPADERHLIYDSLVICLTCVKLFELIATMIMVEWGNI